MAMHREETSGSSKEREEEKEEDEEEWEVVWFWVMQEKSFNKWEKRHKERKCVEKQKVKGAENTCRRLKSSGGNYGQVQAAKFTSSKQQRSTIRFKTF